MSAITPLPPHDSTPAPSPLLTPQQAAAYLCIPEATLKAWRSRRKGYGPKAVRLGRRIRYRRQELDSWITDHLEIDGDPGLTATELGSTPPLAVKNRNTQPHA